MNGDSDVVEGDRVNLRDLEEATVSPPVPDQKAKGEREQFRHAEKMQETQLGWVGRIWGSRSEKPGNISAIVALILVLYLGVLFTFALCSSEVSLADIADTVSVITSIITLILGYLFGSNDRR